MFYTVLLFIGSRDQLVLKARDIVAYGRTTCGSPEFAPQHEAGWALFRRERPGGDPGGAD